MTCTEGPEGGQLSNGGSVGGAAGGAGGRLLMNVGCPSTEMPRNALAVGASIRSAWTALMTDHVLAGVVAISTKILTDAETTSTDTCDASTPALFATA